MPLAEAESLLARCEFHRQLGLSIRSWAAGQATFVCRPAKMLSCPEDGALHGGAVAAVLDTAACFAAMSSAGVDCSTVDLRIDFLLPAEGDRFTVTGTVVREGNRLSLAESSLFCDEVVLACARGLFVKHARVDVST